MPLERVYSSPKSIWGMWRITEDETSLAAEVASEKVPEALSNVLKRLEFLAGRALIKALLAQWDIQFKGIEKDLFGKPFLAEAGAYISLTHSYPHVAAILHKEKNVGIDLEQPKDKLLRIAPRILSPEELEDAGDDVIKHCVYWCAKESLIKIYGKKDLVFASNLRISPFQLAQSGHLLGQIVASDMQTTIPLEYILFDNFVVVVSK
jgi:4'-phosphopantetheinyl transferase